jgi:hypothetical protein
MGLVPEKTIEIIVSSEKFRRNIKWNYMGN